MVLINQMSIGERLKIIRSNLNLTVKDLAEILDIPTRTIGAWERGENPPNEKFLTQLIIKFNININWLLVGKGEIFITKHDDIIENLINKCNISKDDARHIIELIENSSTREFLLRFSKAKKGDLNSIDILIQNLAGIKVAFS